MSKDYLNPTDSDGYIVGQETMAVVVDINDPEERGRIRVRKIGLQDKDRVPDDQLPWIQSSYNNQPSLRGIGFGPPNYMVGSKVFVKTMGNQGHYISGSVPNTETEKQKADLPEDAKSSTPRDFTRGVNENYEKMHSIVEGMGTDFAYKLMNGEYATKWDETTSEKYHSGRIEKAQTPDHYKNRKQSRSVDKLTVGVEQFAGEIKNAQKFIEGKIGEAGSLIPKALEMIDNLYKVTNPLSVPLPTQVLNQQNILQALQGIMQFFNQNKNNEKGEQEETACELIEDLLARKNCRENECRKILNNDEKQACLLRAEELYEQELEYQNQINEIS